MIQNSKHALKMLHNNLFSGAHLLILGDFVTTYQNICNMTFAPGSPLYHCDMEKLDRQDDNTAAQLFSAEALKFLAETYSECCGEITYLFVFGEFIDAIQNHKMSHVEHVTLALRAWYFLID
ncbi:hypothetical protein BDQ17DRAFT_1255410 [Cyathus striatus]|nr:hypothetical protein BDQ17DRAFT_1255410 [Cyathus striatus]